MRDEKPTLLLRPTRPRGPQQFLEFLFPFFFPAALPQRAGFFVARPTFRFGHFATDRPARNLVSTREPVAVRINARPAGMRIKKSPMAVRDRPGARRPRHLAACPPFQKELRKRPRGKFFKQPCSFEVLREKILWSTFFFNVQPSLD